MANRKPKTYGTFTRTGMTGTTRTAYSPAEAVELRFNGWTEQVPTEPDPDPKPAKTGGDDAKPSAAKTTTGGK